MQPIDAQRKRSFPLAALLLAGIAPTAFAHGWHGVPAFADGFAHPFSGIDHLMAMLAVGLWSAATGRHPWLAPLSFAALLLGGALLATNGIAIPAIAPAVAASVLVLGLLVALRRPLPVLGTALLIGGFAVFHGAAHGTELATNAVLPLAGLCCATLLIHGLGIVLGASLKARHPAWLQTLGGGIALCGAGLAAGLI